MFYNHKNARNDNEQKHARYYNKNNKIMEVLHYGKQTNKQTNN